VVNGGTRSIAHAQDRRFPAKAVRDRALAVKRRKHGERGGGSRDPQAIIAGDYDRPRGEWSETSGDRTESGKTVVRTQTRGGGHCSIKAPPIDVCLCPFGSRARQAIVGGKRAAAPESVLAGPIVCADYIEETINRELRERLNLVERAPALHNDDNGDAGEPGFAPDCNGVQTFVAIDETDEQGKKLAGIEMDWSIGAGG
jgi:hypothetical protein